MIRNYDYQLSKEENLAIEILEVVRLNKFNTDNLHFEITNSISKNVFFIYVLKSITDISLIEYYLKQFGINKKFIDTSKTDKKRYLAVWKQKRSPQY